MSETSKRISVIISSLRPERLEITIDNISSEKDLVEVVVASPFVPKTRDFVRHVPVPAPGAPGELTFTQKFNLAAEAAKGEFIFYNNDDIHFASPGWAVQLVKHMESASNHPYLGAVHIMAKGKIEMRHTIFGLLYGNHGCIRKSDLSLIGGKLLDERLFMYYSELDLALRVWAAGGEVGMCPAVVLCADRDVDQAAIAASTAAKAAPAAKAKKPMTYRDIWYRHDTKVFFDLWFKKYFGLFARHYGVLKDKFSASDGVVPPEKENAPLWKIMIFPVINAYINPKRWGAVPSKHNFVRDYWLRLANRRWGSDTYQLPYKPKDVSVCQSR